MDRLFRRVEGRFAPSTAFPGRPQRQFRYGRHADDGRFAGTRGFRAAGGRFVVRKLREAGALILAKANMTQFALGGSSVSSIGGQTRNPYDLTRTPGGSSGGTGASIAASFGIIGTGSDTGQSIRSPASAQNLVGIRPTRGLVSRRGMIPASTTQDEVGPITRTVEDAARALTVMAGYDLKTPLPPLVGSEFRPRIPHSSMRMVSTALASAFCSTCLAAKRSIKR